MKLSLVKGTTSKIVHLFIKDSSVTTGAGLTGLAWNTASLVAYYVRPGDASATAITLQNETVGTWISGGFKEVDATNMPGIYELGIPNACLATGANQVTIFLKGAANMQPKEVEIELTAWNNQDTVRGGLTAMPNVASGSAGAIITSGTGTAQLSVTSGVALADMVKISGDTAAADNFETMVDGTGGQEFAVGTLAISGDMSIGGAMSVADTITFGALTVTNATTLTGAVSLGATLAVTGTTTLAAVSTGAVTHTTLTTSGTTTLNALTVTNAFTVSGATTYTGAVTASNASNNIVGIDVAKWKGTTLPAPDTAGYPKVTIKNGTGAGEIVLDTGVAKANLVVFDSGPVSDLGVAVWGAETRTITGFTAAAKAELQTEANDALVANNLDHLLGTAAVAGDVVNSSVIARMTSKSATPDFSTYNNLTDSPEAVRDRGDAAWTTGGSVGLGIGAYSVMATVNDGATALQNATVQISSAGVTVAYGDTNASGQITFSVDAGTYTVAITKGGYQFTPTTRTVTGNNAGTLYSSALSMTAFVAPASGTPDLCTVSGYVKDASGAAQSGVVVTFTPDPDSPMKSTDFISRDAKTATTDGAGLFSLNLVRSDTATPSGTRYLVTCDALGLLAKHKSYITPSAASLDLRNVADLFQRRG